MVFKIRLKDVGRQRVNKILRVNVSNLESAELLAYREVGKYLISSDTALIPTKKKGKYLVSAGFQSVGEVEIKKEK